MSVYYIKSINFDTSGEVLYLEYCEDGKFYTYIPNTEKEVDLFNGNRSDIISDMESSNFSVGINRLPGECFQEVFTIKLPVDSTELQGHSYDEKINRVNKINHINLYVTEQDYNPSRNYFGWIMVKLPEEMDGIHYVPIIIHNGLGVSVHPRFHRYFIRSFSKKERHLILGYLYLYGTNILFDAYNAFKKGEEVSDKIIKSHQSIAFDYKDEDAPKRIDAGPNKTLKDNERYSHVYDDYKRWVKQNK